MTLARPLALALGLLPALAPAARLGERWSFAWDAHPQAAQVGYFELDIRLPGKLIRERIDGGTKTAVRDVLVPASVPGDGTAVLRACRPNGECSADSNVVALDRTPPQPPTAVHHGFNNQR